MTLLNYTFKVNEQDYLAMNNWLNPKMNNFSWQKRSLKKTPAVCLYQFRHLEYRS